MNNITTFFVILQLAWHIPLPTQDLLSRSDVVFTRSSPYVWDDDSHLFFFERTKSTDTWQRMSVKTGEVTIRCELPAAPMLNQRLRAATFKFAGGPADPAQKVLSFDLYARGSRGRCIDIEIRDVRRRSASRWRLAYPSSYIAVCDVPIWLDKGRSWVAALFDVKTLRTHVYVGHVRSPGNASHFSIPLLDDAAGGPYRGLRLAGRTKRGRPLLIGIRTQTHGAGRLARIKVYELNDRGYLKTVAATSITLSDSWQVGDTIYSPSTNRFAYILSDGDESHLFTCGAEGEATRFIGGVRTSNSHDSIIKGVTWLPSGTALSFERSGKLYVVEDK